MALIELNLEKPALKRTETAESSAKQPTPSATEETKSAGEMKSSEEMEATEESGEGTSTTVEVPEGESVEEKSSGGGMLRRIAMLGATAGAVFAVRKWRSRRKQRAGEATEFEEEWETPQSE